MVHMTNGKTYDELFLINNDISIHQRLLYFLFTEFFKSANNLNPQFE